VYPKLANEHCVWRDAFPNTLRAVREMGRDARLAIPAATHACNRLAQAGENMPIANPEGRSFTWMDNVSAVQGNLQIDRDQLTLLYGCALARNIVDDSYASIHGRLTVQHSAARTAHAEV
jgi:hypothetical protein